MANASRKSLLYTSRIEKVRFHFSGSEEAIANSCVSLTSHESYANNMPYPGGVNSAHMGTTDPGIRCQTCHNNKDKCLGHSGDLVMNYPVWSPMAIDEGRKWLRVICFRCGKIVLKPAEFIKFAPRERLGQASKIARIKPRTCPSCGLHNPVIKKRGKTEPLVLTAEEHSEGKITRKYILYPHMISEIFGRVTAETIITLGKKPDSGPANFILWRIPIPTVCIRPEVRKIGSSSKINSDGLTTLIQILVKKNQAMPAVIPQDIDANYDKNIWALCNIYRDMIRAKSEDSKPIGAQITSKQGILRKNLLGKRCRNMCRSTIVGDPRIRVDELGVPKIFAQTIQLAEVVQDYNRRRLLGYVLNGPNKYPGASMIIKKSTGVTYEIKPGADIELENGDTVMRDYIDGDVINFNRQPTLKVSNIGAHTVKVILDPEINTILMNVIACKWYDADFKLR